MHISIRIYYYHSVSRRISPPRNSPYIIRLPCRLGVGQLLYFILYNICIQYILLIVNIKQRSLLGCKNKIIIKKKKPNQQEKNCTREECAFADDKTVVVQTVYMFYKLYIYVVHNIYIINIILLCLRAMSGNIIFDTLCRWF